MKKVKLLIVFSILGLIALSIIQGYLIKNTYQLKKKAFIGEVERIVGKIDDYSEELDSLSDIWQADFLERVVDYKTHQLQKADLSNGLRMTLDSINGYFTSHITKELIKSKIPYDVKYQKKIRYIILLDSIKSDTLFNFQKEKKIRLGNDFNEKHGNTLSNTLWQTDHNSVRAIGGKKVNVAFDLAFEIQDLIEIRGWKKVVLGRMSVLLLLSGFIFLFVIGLLYFSIKSLITQKKIAEIKTDFVNNITHELKTPLSTLSLATKILKRDPSISDASGTLSTVDTIERQNKRLQNLIDQVLNSSLGYQDIKINPQPIQLLPFLQTVLDDFLLSSADKKVSLTRQIDESDVQVKMDSFFMTTVLLNILENAVKYGKEDVEILVSSKVKNDLLEVSIEDNGIGISTKDHQQIFEKFYRVGNQEVHNVKGLGLGLYYAYQIMKSHQGDLRVKSEKGKGSTFIIQIPI